MIPVNEPSRLTVLIVDDDADMRLYMRGCLRRLGPIEIVEAPDGQTALHLARSIVPGLIISDIVMPGLDGYALHEALKAEGALASIPVLLISGEEADPSMKGEGRAFLSKPFNTKSFLAALAPLLGRAPPLYGERAGL